MNPSSMNPFNMNAVDEPLGPFWMILCPNGTCPTVRHTTRASVEQEAERLARKHPDKEFYVLKAEGRVAAEKVPVRWETF